MTKISVVLADDHPLFRDGVAQSLNESGVFEVVGQCASGREAIALTEEHAPDLVLLDVSMPDGGFFALTHITATPSAPVVVMLTVSEDIDSVTEAISSGAAGYILKGIGSRDLIRSLKDLVAGQRHVPASLADKVMTRVNAPRKSATEEDLLATLSKREEGILRLVCEGKSNKEIGHALDLQEKTVKHYMTGIMQKLQVRNRTEAALLAKGRWGG